MGRNQKAQKTEYDFDQLLRDSFGLNDAKILEGVRLTQEKISDSQIPPASDDGYARLLEKVVDRKIVPYGEKGKEENVIEKKESKGSRCVKSIFRVGLAVGILASVLSMTSVSVGAKRSYNYTKRVRYSKRNDVVYNMGDSIQDVGRLEEAYEKIRSRIGLNVLKLNYIPADLVYIESAISKQRATMYFDYRGSRFYVLQQYRTSDNSFNIVSDRLEGECIYNEWLGEEIVIEEAITENGEKEYSAQILVGNSLYYLSGIIDKYDFKKILENLTLME